MVLQSLTIRSVPPPVFHADHPFVYAIRDTETDAILFIGRVVDPR
jgi:serpin B